MDSKVVAIVLTLAVMTQAGELVLQLSGTIRMVPSDLVKAKILQGIISPVARITSRRMRYFVQLKPDTSDVYVPGFGRQSVLPYGYRRLAQKTRGP